jgi:Acyclic terpene utilisation family protein AtuA
MPMARPVRIANCSGFYGDRLAAAREMLDGPIDVLTGDYLAELTMLILWKARRRDPALGYATTFLRQMEDVLGTCLERGVKVVSNAGGLNPEGLARRINELGLPARVAYITGDDLAPVIGHLQAAGHEFTNLDTGLPLAKAGLPVVTAHAYLGGWGIAAALQAGADVVICPRVTDASLVTGPAAWWHGWRRDDWNALAGAVAAGHVIECGPQATGGNYSFLDEITQRRYPGFPIAEVAADGSSVITKHEGTGGLVSTGTVTAQLLYEIGAPAYLNPDVVAHFDTIGLDQSGPDRVALTGTRGSPPPDTLKVALNMLGGYRNTTTMVLTGLDIEQKAEHATRLLFEVLGGAGRFGEVDVRLLRFDRPDAPMNEQATAHLRITVKDADEDKVGRAFSNAAIELALAGYAGFHTTAPPGGASAFGVYWPALIPAGLVTQLVHLPDGSTLAVPHNSGFPVPQPAHDPSPGPAEPLDSLDPGAPTADVPLGRLCGARSGDKGGDANVGLWATSPRVYAWLRRYLTTGRFRELLTEAAAMPVDRYELPNLLAVNFVVHGLLAPGVSATTRPDAQAKGLGEYLRSRIVTVPAGLVAKSRSLSGTGRCDTARVSCSCSHPDPGPGPELGPWSQRSSNPSGGVAWRGSPSPTSPTTVPSTRARSASPSTGPRSGTPSVRRRWTSCTPPSITPGCPATWGACCSPATARPRRTAAGHSAQEATSASAAVTDTATPTARPRRPSTRPGRGACTSWRCTG